MAHWLSKHRLLICVGVAAVLYLSGLGRPPLWEPDEGRYAEIAREMVVSRDFVTPRDNYVRYFEKPPLLYWATAASIEIFGVNEFAVRLPAATASIGQVALTEALAAMMFGPMTGILAALALAFSPLFFAFARFATPDPALAFFITAAMGAFYAGARAPDLGSGKGRRWMIGVAGMLALGSLVKGPVAILLGGAIALLWLIIEGRARDALRLPWLGCIVVYLGIVCPWLILAAHRNPGFLQFFFVHEQFQRYVADTEHGWGFWFFVPITLGGTWPWIYFAPFAFGEARADQAQPDEARSAVHFLVIWFAVIFVFFSVPRSKLGEYILPALPPLAILAGRGINRIGTSAHSRCARVPGFVAINTAAALAVSAGILVMARRFGAALTSDVLIASAAFLIGAVGAFLISRSTSRPEAMAIPLSLGVLFAMIAGAKARQDVASKVSYRNLARVISPYLEQGCRLASYGHFEQTLPFYTGVRETLVNYRGELAPFGPNRDPQGLVFATREQILEAWSGGQCVILVVNRKDLPKLSKVLLPGPMLIGSEGKKLALYNRSVSKVVEAAPEWIGHQHKK